MIIELVQIKIEDIFMVLGTHHNKTERSNNTKHATPTLLVLWYEKCLSQANIIKQTNVSNGV